MWAESLTHDEIIASVTFILLVVGRGLFFFAAVWLTCFVLATWSYERGVTADRGRGALSQRLKPSGGLQTKADLNIR